MGVRWTTFPISCLAVLSRSRKSEKLKNKLKLSGRCSAFTTNSDVQSIPNMIHLPTSDRGFTDTLCIKRGEEEEEKEENRGNEKWRGGGKTDGGGVEGKRVEAKGRREDKVWH